MCPEAGASGREGGGWGGVAGGIVVYNELHNCTVTVTVAPIG